MLVLMEYSPKSNLPSYMANRRRAEFNSPRHEGDSSIGRGVSPCSEYKKNMSPERAAETARIEIVALFMPTCLSSAALVPRAQLFYILLPGASPLRGSAAGLLSCRPLSGLKVRFAFGSHPAKLQFVEFIRIPKQIKRGAADCARH